MTTTTGTHPLRDLLHEATHRVPGVPAHVEHPPGHQGRANVRRGGALQARPVAAQGQPVAAQEDERSRGGGQGGVRHSGIQHRGVQHRGVQHSGLNHSPARQPRVLVAWQRRVAAFFGQEL